MLSDYDRIAAAIQFRDGTAAAPLACAALADHVGLSEVDLQRLFQRWSGVSPQRFFGGLTLSHARQCLTRSHDVVLAALRAPDRAGGIEAASPAERRPGGITIRWGIAASPYGPVGMGIAGRRVCWLDFLPPSAAADDAVQRLAQTWPHARLEHHPEAAAAKCARVFAGERPPLLLGGTIFQRQVWRLLVRIPPGTVTTYGAIAAALERPGAGRAVGSAVGRNSIGYLVPCHRVIRQSGELASFRWGIVRKKALIGHEAAQRAVPSST